MVQKAHTLTPAELVAAEKGSFQKSGSWSHSFGMVYPNTYYLGMSNLGHQLVSRIIADDPRWALERFYCDFEPLVSMENQQPPNACDAVAFSVAFELDYLNIVDFLRRSSIPVRADERGSDFPLIIGAGVCIDVNRLPIYDFIDVFINGEGEELIQQFMNAFQDAGGNRKLLLEKLAELPGFEVTSGARRAHGLDVPVIEDFRPPRLKRVTAEHIDRYTSCSHIVTPHTEFSNMCLVELARGCPYRCTFCYVGHNLNPYQVSNVDRIKGWIEQRLEWTDKFGFIASAVASHPEIDELCQWSDEIGIKISFASLRAEDVTMPMLHSLARSGAKTLTIAPEAGSFRLRKLLGKARLPDERIFWVVEEAVKLGIPNLKMYFMIGLPTETEEDVLAIPQLISRVQKAFVDVSRSRGRIGTIGLNVGIFVPKPNTPLEKFEPMALRQARKHWGILERSLRKINNVSAQAPSATLAQVQAVLSRGDTRTSDFLLNAHANGGDWKRALREWTPTPDLAFAVV